MTQRHRGLTLIEVVAVLLLLLGLFMLLTVYSRTHCHRPDKLVNNTRLRSIHQSTIIYAWSNNERYPGLNEHGQAVGLDVEDRFKAMLDADILTPEYLISPLEHQRREWAGGPFTQDHYSYAMLQVPDAGGRYDEWRETYNPDAVVLSDRNTGTADQPTSLHTSGAGAGWEGSVAYNDGHVEFQSSHEVDTTYAGVPNADDHLFNAAGHDDAHLIDTGN